MPKISKVALVAAVLSLSAPVSLSPALSEEKTLTLSDTAMQTKIEIPTINAVNSSMDETAIRDVLTGGFMKHVDDLAHLSADSITVPEVDITTSVKIGSESTETKATYKDLVLTHVKDGVAESVSAGTFTSATNGTSVTFGSFKTGTFDFGATLGLYGLVPAQGTDMKLLYKDMSFDGGTVVTPLVKCTLGKVTIASVSARPLKVSFAEMMQASQALSAAKGATPPPEAVGTLISFFGDMFSAFQSDPVNVDGMQCAGTGDNGKPFDISFANLSMGGYQPGIYPAISVKGVDVKAGEEGTVSLDSATLKAIDLTGPIAALKDVDPKTLDEAWFTGNWRKLIPAFGGFAFSGLKVDVPDPEAENSRIQANVADFDLSLGNYLNGIPTKITSTTTGFDVPINKNNDDDNMKMLAALGITRVNLNYELAASWDKDSKTIKLDKLSVSGNDLGSIAVATVIGNAGPELFDLDPDVEQTASMGLTVKSLAFDLMDAGIGDKLVPLMAEEEKMDPATYRTKMAGVAEGAALQMLGATDAARALGMALGDFISGKAKSLHIDAVAKDPNGIGMAQFMAAQDDPTVLSGAVDITGSAK